MIRPRAAGRSVLLRACVERDSDKAPRLRLSGRLHGNGASLAVFVHGLGGSAESYYMRDATREALAMGHAAARLNLRGADGSGRDFYHAGQTEDLRAYLGSKQLAKFDSIFIVGFSLGGHIAFRAAAEGLDSRVKGVASVSGPIDLAGAVAIIDRPAKRMFRDHLLRGLKEHYRQVAQYQPELPSVRAASKIGTIEEWDERIVAPRYGFASARDYWAQATVNGSLDDIQIPALYIGAEYDPMVPDETTRPFVEAAQTITSRFVDRAGHVGFSPRVDLGLGFSGGSVTQIIRWLQRASGQSAAGAVEV